MTRLRYPANLDTNQNDFIKFRPFKYNLNQQLPTNATSPERGAYPPLPKEEDGSDTDAEPIVLYMPNSTPATHYGQAAEYQTFPGPIGNLLKGALGVAGADFSNGDAMGTLEDKLNNLGKNTDATGAGYQFALDKLASIVGSDAATAVALGQQKAFNPNAEMIYRQPYHRKYEFSFDFIPKSREDAKRTDEIIYQFKKWSAPSIENNAQFIEMPCLWRITYHEAGKGGIYKRMNLFKPVMITNVGIQDNPMSDFHITIKDDTGHVPVHTTMKLYVQETMPPTREDHTWALENGYLRGF